MCSLRTIIIVSVLPLLAPSGLLAQPVQRQIPYPIVLVHGFGGSGEVWLDTYKVVPFFKSELGLGFGGFLTIPDHVVIDTTRSDERDGQDFYAVSFSNAFDAINNQAQELGRFIEHVLRETGAERVILLGFSMGGVVSRAYLTTHRQNHRVKKLITVGSPHQGTPLALVYDIRKWAEVHAPVTVNFGTFPAAIKTIRILSGYAFRRRLRGHLLDDLSAAPEDYVLYALIGMEALETTVQLAWDSSFSFTAGALSDLRPPRNAPDDAYKLRVLSGPTFLFGLNTREHPLDLDYVSIIGKIDFSQKQDEYLGHINDFLQGETQDNLVLKLLAPLGNVVLNIHEALGSQRSRRPAESWLGGGDGLVSVTSQDLSQVPFFRSYPNAVTVYTIDGVVHLEECLHGTKLARAIPQPVQIVLDAKRVDTYAQTHTLTGTVEDYLLTKNHTTIAYQGRVDTISVTRSIGEFSKTLPLDIGVTTVTIRSENPWGSGWSGKWTGDKEVVEIERHEPVLPIIDSVKVPDDLASTIDLDIYIKEKVTKSLRVQIQVNGVVDSNHAGRKRIREQVDLKWFSNEIKITVKNGSGLPPVTHTEKFTYVPSEFILVIVLFSGLVLFFFLRRSK